jgi:hypothetical protein
MRINLFKNTINYETISTLGKLLFCSVFGTNTHQKVCWFRYYILKNGETEKEIMNAKTCVFAQYFEIFSIPKEVDIRVREMFAKNVFWSFHNIFRQRDHVVHQLFTKQDLVVETCDYLVKCNLPENSPLLTSILQEIDLIANDQIAFASYQKCVTSPEEFDDDLDEEKLDKALDYIHEINKNGIGHLDLKEREKIALTINDLIVIQLSGDGDRSIILENFCGKNGILRKCHLPTDSKALAQILMELNELTESQASRIYNRGSKQS